MKKFDRAAARQEFLWAGYEDWTGLWEAVWWIQTEYPEMTGAPAREAARGVLSELLNEGLVYVCLLDEDTGREKPIPAEKARRILARDESWNAPDSVKGQLRYVTTEAGAKPFFKPAEAQS
jgi:hypothetical protein